MKVFLFFPARAGLNVRRDNQKMSRISRTAIALARADRRDSGAEAGAVHGREMQLLFGGCELRPFDKIEHC
jgi:hypothetical protein